MGYVVVLATAPNVGTSTCILGLYKFNCMSKWTKFMSSNKTHSTNCDYGAASDVIGYCKGIALTPSGSIKMQHQTEFRIMEVDILLVFHSR